ncbi:MAG: hypothetical protein P8J87_02250, partial [Verrucomicrobiales bacterium]|nr:hypothetical protein [Verrucomicrobiales bacterium]
MKMMRAFFGIALSVVFCGEVSGQGTVTGFGRFEQIAGNSSGGYKQLFEWDLFLSPEGGGVWAGISRRLGAPPGEVARGDGFYRIDGVPAGTYTLYVNQPDFFASPKVVGGVTVVDGQTTNVNVELDVDYSTTFAEADEWTPWEPDAYQTFLATGSAVRGISWRHAGAYEDADAEVSLLEDNGNADVRLWDVVATKTKQNIAGDTDEWVRFQSGEAPMVAGRQYAVRVQVDDGMAIYKRDKDGFSYANGNAFDGGGVAQDWDLNITVFVDRDGTSVTHTRTTSGAGEFDGALSAARWGQTFVASGTSLAAVDLFAASVPTGFPVTWQVFEGGPGGVPVGG